jgi:hypothetical protein
MAFATFIFSSWSRKSRTTAGPPRSSRGRKASRDVVRESVQIAPVEKSKSFIPQRQVQSAVSFGKSDLDRHVFAVRSKGRPWVLGASAFEDRVVRI